MTETKPQPARHLGHGAGEGRLVLHLHRKLPLFSYLPAEREHIFLGFFGHTHICSELKSKNLTLSISQGHQRKTLCNLLK